jgi:archaellum biogenesis ATPase FlaH
MSQDNDFYNDEDLGVGMPPSGSEDLTGSAELEEDVEPASYSIALDGDEDDLVIDDDEQEDSEDVFSAEERLRGFSDKVLSACIKGGETSKYALSKLMSVTNPRLFRDENYVLFSVLYTYRSKLRYINIDEEFIRLFLNRNRELLVKARGYIDVHAYGDVDGSPELGYISGVVKHYRRLKGMDEQSVVDFETNFEKYLVEFKAIEAIKAFRTSQQIISEGVKIGRKFYVGFEDSCSYLQKQLAEIEGLVDFGKGTGFVKMNEVIMEEKEDNRKSVKIGDFDRLDALNRVYGGIYTGMFYQIIAPPKAGKTKLCARLCHTMVVKHGTNVTVWAQEGGHEAWTAQMRAIHFDYIYNTGADVTQVRYGVDQNTIMKGTFKTDELRQLELSSKLDLASNQDYGVVDFIDRPFNVETFIDEIDTSVKENHSRAVIIDYLQLIGSQTGIKSTERIAEAYRKLLVYCKKNNIAVITPGQYKQEAFDEMLKKSDISTADLRTAGGGSSEVERTPDVIFALWATSTDLQNNVMHIIPMPSRMNVSFPPVKVMIHLGTCQFISVDE